MVEDCTIAPIALAAGEGERMSFRGVDIVFKSPINAEDGWTVLDYTLPPRQFGAPLHYHATITESFYVLSGEFWFRAGDKEITVGPGGFVFVPPGTPHAFANRSDAPARLLGHASSARHKEYLYQVFRMMQNEETWPPKDPRAIIELGKRYDTIILGGA
jgi:quercetin dioxygenase-like cupin family protein